MYLISKNPEIFLPYSTSNISVNDKFSNPYVVFCERYKKEKLFEREKKEAVRILMHL
jgi:hypothetical protein